MMVQESGKRQDDRKASQEKQRKIAIMEAGGYIVRRILRLKTGD
jgi:hypothetical protein